MIVFSLKTVYTKGDYKVYQLEKGGIVDMKVARFVLKIVGFSLAAAAAACCVIAYWDKITAGFRAVGEKMGCSCCAHPAEYDDYADWDE